MIRVRVKEGSGEPEIAGDIVTIYTSAKRENNQANQDIRKQLSALFKVDPGSIRLVRGRTSRNKTFIIPE